MVCGSTLAFVGLAGALAKVAHVSSVGIGCRSYLPLGAGGAAVVGAAAAAAGVVNGDGGVLRVKITGESRRCGGR